MTRPQASQFGRYELLTRIGRGGMAETWKARLVAAAGITKPVLIKKVLPQNAQDEAFIRMFISEARISATLSHGNIAQVYDFGKADGEYFLAMEFVDGQPLHHVIKRALQTGMTCVPVHLATFIALEMCRGLHYAHTRTDEQGVPLGIVHRDISPDNVLISYEGQVKLVDFGIAKARLQRGFSTEPGLVKGKYLFFSPEQARGEEVDARTDVWATGVVLYEMVCGRLPLEGTEYVVMNRLQQGQFPRPRELHPELPAELDAIIMKALAVDKEERFESAHAFGDALAGFLYSSTPRFSPLSLSYLLRELFRETLTQQGQDASVPGSFREELSLWRAAPKPPPAPEPLFVPPSTEQTAPITQEGPATAPRPRGLRAATTSSGNPPAMLFIGVGVLVCLLLGGSALLWSRSASPHPVAGEPPPPGPIAAQAPVTEGPPPPQPLVPPSVPAPKAAPPEAAPEPPPERIATWPVDAIRLDAKLDVLRVNITVVATLDLKPERVYNLREIPFDRNQLNTALETGKKYDSYAWKKAERRVILPLLYLLQGKNVSAKDALGTVSRSPLRIQGASSVLLFTFGPRMEEQIFVPRMVQVEEDETRKSRKAIIHTEWMTAIADKAFLLKGLDPSAQYRLTLSSVDEGAFTRGTANGPVRTVACVQDASQEVLPQGKVPVSPIKAQRFLLQENEAFRIGGVGALRCGFVDDDASDNQGEMELSVEQLEDKGRTGPLSPKELEPEKLLATARTHFAKGRYSLAVATMRQCVATSPRNADCHLLLGDSLSKLRRSGEALEAYNGFLQLVPSTDARAHRLLEKLQAQDY